MTNATTESLSYTHHTAATQFAVAAGIRFAYRRFGKKAGIPEGRARRLKKLLPLHR